MFKRSKHGNVRTNGYMSKGECARAQELKMLERAGMIKDLREQVEFVLIPKQDGERACKYKADFVYVKDGETIVEDFKGQRLPEYVIKRKLMLWVHGIRILETSA